MVTTRRRGDLDSLLSDIRALSSDAKRFTLMHVMSNF